VRMQARSRVWPGPSGLGVFKAGQARNGGNARPTAPSGQRAVSHRAQRPTRAPRAQRPTCTLRQGTTLPSPLPGAFAQVQRRVSDGVTRPRPTYGYNRFYN
jgi:hypothetical protein